MEKHRERVEVAVVVRRHTEVWNEKTGKWDTTDLEDLDGSDTTVASGTVRIWGFGEEGEKGYEEHRQETEDSLLTIASRTSEWGWEHAKEYELEHHQD